MILYLMGTKRISLTNFSGPMMSISVPLDGMAPTLSDFTFRPERIQSISLACTLTTR